MRGQGSVGPPVARKTFLSLSAVVALSDTHRWSHHPTTKPLYNEHHHQTLPSHPTTKPYHPTPPPNPHITNPTRTPTLTDHWTGRRRCVGECRVLKYGYSTNLKCHLRQGGGRPAWTISSSRGGEAWGSEGEARGRGGGSGSGSPSKALDRSSNADGGSGSLGQVRMDRPRGPSVRSLFYPFFKILLTNGSLGQVRVV